MTRRFPEMKHLQLIAILSLDLFAAGVPAHGTTYATWMMIWHASDQGWWKADMTPHVQVGDEWKALDWVDQAQVEAHLDWIRNAGVSVVVALKAHALSDRWDCHGYIEDYACQCVESLRLYYDATGDKAFVAEMWPFLAKQMQWFLDRRTPRGLVLARQYTSFDDPLAYVTCEGTALNAFIVQAFRDASYLSHVVGGKSYEQDALALAAAINKHLWNEQARTYQSGFVKDALLGPTEHAALLALDRGIVPPERIAGVRQWFLANYRLPVGWHCGQNDDYEKMVASRTGIGMPVTYYWVFREFYRMDEPDMDAEALGEMRCRWERMVNTSTDTGTLWEMFTGPESCHNYGAVPAYFLSSFVLGVRLDGPVWNQRLVIEPRLGDLTSAEGVVVTEFGPVPVSWKRQDQELTFRFVVPKCIQTTLRLPDGGNLDALRNGTTRNGSGGDETLNDGSTFRAYDKASVLTFQLDTAIAGQARPTPCLSHLSGTWTCSPSLRPWCCRAMAGPRNCVFPPRMVACSVIMWRWCVSHSRTDRLDSMSIARSICWGNRAVGNPLCLEMETEIHAPNTL